jgi:hypothetical protein
LRAPCAKRHNGSFDLVFYFSARLMMQVTAG